MNIGIYTKNIENVYSGGRFYTMFLATALSQKHKVYYISNVKPIFTRDFEIYKDYNNIDFIIDDRFKIEDSIKLDIIILIPDLDIRISWFRIFYLNIIKKAYRDHSKILLLNFETPNWFNDISLNKKDSKKWKYWLKSSYFCDGILSSVDIATSYAKSFFKNKELEYFRCYPAINQKYADIYKNKIVKKNEIIIFARFIDSHKGSFGIIDILSEKLSGFTIKIVIGNGKVPKLFNEEIINISSKNNIKIKYLYKISDEEKFKEIASSRLLLFLSDFEGFGSPPVEALYMGIPVLAKYLDVLYEVSGDNIFYIKDNNFKDIDILNIMDKKVDYNKNIEFDIFSENLNMILNKLNQNQNQKTILKKLKLKLINIDTDIKYKVYESYLFLKKYFKSKYIEFYFKEKYNLVNSSKNILIYGTGEYAKSWTSWCKDNNKNIIGYIVSKREESKTFLGKPILLPQEISDYDILILGSISGASALNMIETFPSKLIYLKRTVFTHNEYLLKEKESFNKIIEDSLELVFVKRFGI